MSSSGGKINTVKSDPLTMPVDLLVHLCSQDSIHQPVKRPANITNSYAERLHREHAKVLGQPTDGDTALLKQFMDIPITPVAVLKLEMSQILNTSQLQNQSWKAFSESEADLFEDKAPDSGKPEKPVQASTPRIETPTSHENNAAPVLPFSPKPHDAHQASAEIIDLSSLKTSTFHPEDTLFELADMLAALLVPDHTAIELSVEQIRTSETAVTYIIHLGEKQALVKIFAPGTVALAEFEREICALEGFHGDLVPRLLFVAKHKRLMMTEFIQGETLSDGIAKGTLLRTAEHLGQWIGQLYNIAPQQAYKGDWANYLENYDSGLNPDVLEQQAAILQTTKISHLTLAHNDNALSNYILGSDMNIYGLDFSDACFKPEGWDLAMAARAMFLKHPDQLPRLSAAMLHGYQLTVKKSTLPDNFDQIMNTIAIANLVSEP